MHRRRRRLFEQPSRRCADAPVAIVRDDERRHDFASATAHPDRQTPQRSAMAVRCLQTRRDEGIARGKREGVAAFVMDRTFDNWNDAPRSTDVVAHCQRGSAAAEDEMHLVAVSPGTLDWRGCQRGFYLRRVWHH